MAKHIRTLVWGQAPMGMSLAFVVLCVADKQFDLVLNSAANAPLCLAKETWPAESGCH